MKYLNLFIIAIVLFISSCDTDSTTGACISSDKKKCWDDSKDSECRSGELVPDTDCASLGYTCPEGMICIDD